MKIQLDERNARFQKRDKGYVTLLKGDPNFENLILEARKRCGLKKLHNNFATPKLLADSTKEAEAIVAVYNLPDSWVASVAFLIVAGKLSSPGGAIRISGMQSRYPSGRFSPLRITITEKVSLDEIWQFLRENKDYIRGYLDKLPRKRFFLKDSKLKSEIFQLRYGRNQKPKQIMEHLIEKYGFDSEIVSKLDEATISNWILDYKKALKGLPLSSPLKSLRD